MAAGSCQVSLTSTPKGLAVHLIADTYGTHKHPSVAAWLDKHATRPRAFA